MAITDGLEPTDPRYDYFHKPDGAPREMHDMFHPDGNVRPGVRHIAEARSSVESLGDYSVTLKLARITPDGANAEAIRHFAELCGLWCAPERYQTGNGANRWVNSNAADSKNYCDVSIECGCGAVFTTSHDTKFTKIHDEHNHRDDCTIQQRLRARANLADARKEMFERLVPLGWRAEQVGNRLGMSKAGISTYARSFGVDYDALREEYLRRMANTYVCLTECCGFKASDARDVYGISTGWASRVVRQHGDFEWQTNEWTPTDRVGVTSP